MSKAHPKNLIFVPLIAAFSIFNMPSITLQLPRIEFKMPDTTSRMPRFEITMPDTTPRMPDTTPRMPDTTPVMPDTTPRMPGLLNYFYNFYTGIRKFLAPPTPSNIPMPLGQWQQDAPTPTPTPIYKTPAGTLQIGTYKSPAPSVTLTPNQPVLSSFSINAPSGWYRSNGSGTLLVRFDSPKVDIQKIEDGSLTTNAFIIVRATDAYSSLDDFVTQYKSSNSAATLLSSSNTTVNGQTASSLEFTYTTTIETKKLLTHEMDLLLFKNGYSFLIKGTSADSAWNENSSDLRSALYSFKFN